MSAIAKTLTSVIALSAILATGVQAQGMDENFFSELTTNTPSGAAAGSDEILQKIEDMMSTVSDIDLGEKEDHDVTIEEIDQKNRSAQRLKNDISLRNLRYQEMRSQLEMLLTLDEARQKIITDAQERADAQASPSPETNTDNEDQESAQNLDNQAAITAAENQEQMSIPRVSEIYGSADRRTAIIASVTGVQQEVSVGDTIVNGFTVKEVSLRGIVVTGNATGKSYFIAPSPPTAAPPPQGSQPSQAFDLGTGSFPGMF